MLPRHARILLLALLLTASLVVSVPALLVPAEVQVNPPNEDLPEGTVVDVSAYIEIIPSGATTFSESHTLTLSTDLRDARWQVVVMVDGRQAAVISQEGSRVFVNGFLLSYPDTRDVGVQVRLTGSVASLPPGSSIMVLRWAELNARSQVVTGSEYTVNRQVITLPAPQSIPQTVHTTLPVASPTKAAFSLLPVVVSFGLIISWMGTRKRR